jgi:LAGLIDADG endonuclease
MGKAIGGNSAIEARIAAAQGLSEADAHALAGFIDAEGSLRIDPNNGGRSWQCGMALAQRIDDADVLFDVCHATGLGRVTLKPAVRGSRPQATWSVASKRECAELVRLLERHPLRGRKRLEFAVWAEAVRRWATRPYGAPSPGEHAAMRRAAAEIRQLKRYVDPGRGAAVDRPAARDELVWFLGGFFSGEGYLEVDRSRARLVVKLRRDDRPLLRQFAAGFGVGRVYDLWSRGGPQASWVVYRHDELATAIAVLDRAGLRGRKRREYAVWRRAAAESAAARAEGRRRQGWLVDAAVAELRAMRAYRYREPPSTADRSYDLSEARAAYTAVLQECAARLDGPVTWTAYDRLRRQQPRWPTRNTIALAFGSWAEAVRAAGLEERLSARARLGSVEDP